MNRYLAITTCNGDQWTKYGRAMARTFVRHWPADVPLWLYAEGFEVDEIEEAERACKSPFLVFSLNAAAPWLATFKALYRDQKYNGGANGRDFRHDAVRFAHKVAAIGAAAETADCDVLIWMDADIVTHGRVTLDWLDGLFPEPATIAWLDRDNCYPECGFLMFRMPTARPVIRSIVKAYRNGHIFELSEWHDSYVIQHYVQKSTVRAHSLSGPEGRKYRGHPWLLSPLAECMDHLKGEARKAAGRSNIGRDMHLKRPEPYWQ